VARLIALDRSSKAVTEIGLETERITNKGKARATTSEKEIEQVPNSPERPSTPRPKENEYSVVRKTPCKLTPARAPLALQSALEPSQLALPPPSTALAVLYKGKGGKGGKERKRTTKAVESKT
jgi:hypothetical protein